MCLLFRSPFSPNSNGCFHGDVARKKQGRGESKKLRPLKKCRLNVSNKNVTALLPLYRIPFSSGTL